MGIFLFSVIRLYFGYYNSKERYAGKLLGVYGRRLVNEKT
jgi:hypothetical protein